LTAAYDSGAEAKRFVVYRKDGRILEYVPITARREDRTSIAEDSTELPKVTKVSLAWLLAAERDRAGNEMRYQHEVTLEEQSPYAIEYHPSAIEYTFQLNTNGSARRQVVFTYEARPDPAFAYVSGVKVQTTKRLRAIEMHAPNPVDPSPVWRYTLGYKESDTHRSLLAKVTKCGALGGCLLAKNFYYSHPSGPVFPQAHHSSYQMAETAAGAAHLVFDADGDGRDELLYASRSKAIIATWPSTTSLEPTAAANTPILRPASGSSGISVTRSLLRKRASRAWRPPPRQT
jgi:hypothetical protein